MGTSLDDTMRLEKIYSLHKGWLRDFTIVLKNMRVREYGSSVAGFLISYTEHSTNESVKQ